jgi:hypothetical protein
VVRVKDVESALPILAVDCRKTASYRIHRIVRLRLSAPVRRAALVVVVVLWRSLGGVAALSRAAGCKGRYQIGQS